MDSYWAAQSIKIKSNQLTEIFSKFDLSKFYIDGVNLEFNYEWKDGPQYNVLNLESLIDDFIEDLDIMFSEEDDSKDEIDLIKKELKNHKVDIIKSIDKIEYIFCLDFFRDQLYSNKDNFEFLFPYDDFNEMDSGRYIVEYLYEKKQIDIIDTVKLQMTYVKKDLEEIKPQHSLNVTEKNSNIKHIFVTGTFDKDQLSKIRLEIEKHNYILDKFLTEATDFIIFNERGINSDPIYTKFIRCQKQNKLNYTDFLNLVNNTCKVDFMDKTSSNLSEKKRYIFAATGKFEKFTRDSIKLFIEEKGHKLLDKISTNADYLINNDIHSNSSKNTFANSNNIPIISELELIKLIDSNSISDNVTSEKSYKINHNLQTDFNIENLIGYYGKYKSSKDKLAKFEIINDISFSDDSINIGFDKTINEYAYCHQDTKIGDFLLLESGKIVMISNFQNFANPSSNIHVSTHYFHKIFQESNHRFGVFYNDVEFDVKEQSFRYDEPHDGFYSNDLEQFFQGSYQSDTLIFNSYFGFISKNEDGNYIEAGVEVDQKQFNDAFWDTYSEIFDMHSFNGIPKLEDIKYLEKDFLIQDERIKNTFEMNDLLTEVEYFYIDLNNKQSVTECIKERLSSTLAVALAYASDSVLLLVKGEQDHLFIILEKNFDSYLLIAKNDSHGKFELVIKEKKDNHKKNEFIVDVSFDNGKKYSYNSKISVKVGDLVKVSGKISKIGKVVKIQSGWNDNPFMQEIIEVTSSQKK